VTTYMIRRVLVAVPTLMGVTIAAFLLLRVLPGDVAEMILRGESGEGAAMPWSIEKLREELGLNRPLIVHTLPGSAKLSGAISASLYGTAAPWEARYSTAFPSPSK